MRKRATACAAAHGKGIGGARFERNRGHAGQEHAGLCRQVHERQRRGRGELRQLIEGLDGIYVRDYEFDKEGQFSRTRVEQLRKYFETSEWSPIVRERERKTGETTDVMVKLVNGESHGMFILTSSRRS
jgi:hypothetical protein